jgi:hypothetical protein
MKMVMKHGCIEKVAKNVIVSHFQRVPLGDKNTLRVPLGDKNNVSRRVNKTPHSLPLILYF